VAQVEKVDAVVSLPAGASSKEGFAELHALMPLLISRMPVGLNFHARMAWPGRRSKSMRAKSALGSINITASVARSGQEFCGHPLSSACSANAWALAGDTVDRIEQEK
jgi:hypothetical protein